MTYAAIEVENLAGTGKGTLLKYDGNGWRQIPDALPEEAVLALFVNGEELVEMQCTLTKVNCLVVGFLASQGLISSLDDIEMMRICEDELVADVRLKKPTVMPTRRVLTSGCGGGSNFDTGSGLAPVKSKILLSPQQVLACVNQLLAAENEAAARKNRGVHLSALSDGDVLLVKAEDIGRHNTVDKIWGECILRKIRTCDRVLITTGRISSEMVLKAVRMEVPVVISPNSATGRAVELARKLGVTIAGYARASGFTVFCGEEHISRCG
jgi:FdhD protein